MSFNEEFNKAWEERVNEYETIPDKSKISELDREFARGYFFALDEFENVIYNYTDQLDCNFECLDKIVEEIVKKYDEYARQFMRDDWDELVTSILDNYVE